MFDKRFSLDTAYALSARIVLNYFPFFVLAIAVSVFACAVYLAVLSLIDIFALRYHLAPLMKMFYQVFYSATGSLHYTGFYMRDIIGSYFPSEITQQVFGRDVISFDISDYEWFYVFSWIIPTALALKLFLDVIFIGWTKIAIDLNDNKQVSISYLFKYYYLAPRVFVVNFVVGLLTLFGCFLFIIPGVFIYQRLRFSKHFIIDKNLSIIKSLQSSWALTKDSVVSLLGFSMISVVFDSVSITVLLAGLFFIPLHNQAEAHVYVQMMSIK